MTVRRLASRPVCVLAALAILGAFAPSSAQPVAPPTLFDRVGIGADWGPHWATGPGPAASDPRDTQVDGAFPAEICLLRNAGFKTIRLYGENVPTWLAVLDAVDDVNNGKLNCNPTAGPPPGCKATGSCMSVVYQVAICGPDPRTLAWNGTYSQIGQVKCYEVGKPVADEAGFKDSVDAELLKLGQVIANSGDKFAANVSLVFVGNEILFSRGVCSNGGAPCTDSRDCGSGTCSIGHYCSDQLSGPTPPAECSSSNVCGHGASCTDVTNVDPLRYAFGRVQQSLNQLGASAPPISISLQMDLLVSPSFGDDPRTAPLMYSRELLGQALPNKIIAANTYPDQWGKVTINQVPTTCAGGSFPSCVGPTNAVRGQALLPGCTNDPRYFDPVTGEVAHSIDNYFARLKSYYPNFDLMIAETGWHTSGTCVAYNDCLSTYSAADAATYYADLYAYVQQKKIPTLAFQPFDQRTKQCDPAGRGPAAVAEANYGVFTNFCQLKGGNQALLPPAGPGSPGPNLSAFNALLDDDPTLGGKSCRPQTLVGVTGFGSTGICEHNTGIACLTGYASGDAPGNDKCPPGPGSSTNRCVFGYCDNDTSAGCNPGDPTNPAGCGECKRAGNCFGVNPPGLFTATTSCAGATCIAACRSVQTCDGARAPFTTNGKCGDGTNECGCFVAMAPATQPVNDQNTAYEAPGFALTYSKGAFQFQKERTLLPEIVADANGFEVFPVWGNVFLGQGWTLGVVNPPGTTVSDPGPCPVNTVAALNVANPLQPSLTWSNNWAACSYQVGGVNASNPTRIVFPRGYLTHIPTWSQTFPCFAGADAIGTSSCGGGGPEPVIVSFDGTSGKAQNVGVAKDTGNVRISGRFKAPVAVRLDLAALTIDGLLDEVDGAGELSRRPGGTTLLPMELTARGGGKPTAATYQTPSGERPNVKVEVKTRDAETGLMEFSISVDRDSMPVGPARCAGSPSRTSLRTSFTLDDGSGQPLVVDATLPWRCRNSELRLP